MSKESLEEYKASVKEFFDFLIMTLLLIFSLVFLLWNEEKGILDHFENAVHVENHDELKNYINTSGAGFSSYGTLTAEDFVSYPDVEGNYLYIVKVKETYNRDIIQSIVGDKWSEVSREEKHSQDIAFDGIPADVDNLTFFNAELISTVNVSKHTRYRYYGITIDTSGTVMRNDGEKTVTFYAGYDKETLQKNIEEEYRNHIILISVFFLPMLLVLGTILLFDKKEV